MEIKGQAGAPSRVRLEIFLLFGLHWHSAKLIGLAVGCDGLDLGDISHNLGLFLEASNCIAASTLDKNLLNDVNY